MLPTQQDLIAENKKLKAALSGLIPWAGESPEGPNWATAEAKARNKAMCDNGTQEIASSN